MEFNLDLKNINYVKIIYNDQNDTQHCIKASLKSIDKREILVCSKFEELINIPYPQNVSVNFITETGIYKTNTTLKYTQQNEPHMYLALETPIDVSYQQNREYFRVKIDNDIILNFDNTIINTNAYDISANGIRIKLYQYIEIPPIVNLNLLLGEKNIKLKAKFIRTDREDEILKASFKFIDISENNIDIISQFCIKKQLENKRNALTK